MNPKLFLKFLLIPVLVFFSNGCASEYNLATRQEEVFYYSTDKEVKIGESIAKAIEKEYKLVDDPLVQNRVQEIGKKIVSVSDRKDINYSFYVLDDKEVNAFALPGGFIYVNKGLIEKVNNDDELAGVLAHEVGHLVARHSIKKLQAIMGYSLLRVLISQVPQGGADLGEGADAAFVQIILGYAREDELLADQLSVHYTRLAGYDPQGMVNFLNRLHDDNLRGPLRPLSYAKTHPYVPDRIRVIKQELGENMNFTDYINIEQKTHGE